MLGIDNNYIKFTDNLSKILTLDIDKSRQICYNKYRGDKMRKIIECDVDGVLLDIYTPIEVALEKRGTPFSFEREVRTWGMTECGGRAKELKALLSDPELRSQSHFYIGAIDFLRNLNLICNNRGWVLALNSHEWRIDTANVKAQILDNLRLTYPYLSNVCINISKGTKKEMLNSYIVIDDAIPNIEQSVATHRILYGMFHNTPMYNKIPKGAERIEGYESILQRVASL